MTSKPIDSPPSSADFTTAGLQTASKAQDKQSAASASQSCRTKAELYVDDELEDDDEFGDDFYFA